MMASAALALAALPGADAQAVGVDEALNPVDTITDAMTAPCSCDCCQVEDALPDEKLQTDTGKEVKTKCGATAFRSDQCPDVQCKGSGAATTLFVSAVKENVDYSRFCAMFCYPVYSNPGSTCAAYDVKDVKKIATPDGNGKALMHAAPPAPADQELKFAGAPPAPDEIVAEAKQAADAAKVDQQIVWDMRKLIGERLRSEAGAHVSRGMASMAHVQASEYGTNRQAVLAARVANAVQPFQGTIATGVGNAEGSAEEAAEAAATTRSVLLAAKRAAAQVAQETKALAIAEVKKQAAAAAKREADAEVILRAWDKPPSWPRVLAVRAADPYLKAMVGAIERTSEYDSYARGLQGQSLGAQAKAQALTTQANMALAHGDKITAATERLQVTGLLSKAKALQAEAKKFWNIASNVRETIGEWQIAGTKAAAHTAWEFALAITPPPP